MDKLVLFDIDKTLIHGSPVKDKIAFPQAFKVIYGVDANIDSMLHHGMTDQQIIIEVMKEKGLSEEVIKSKLGKCMDKMVEVFNKNIHNDKIVILGGVKEALEELDKNNIPMGLVTGNLELIARGKLKKAGLDNYFKVGGFGSENVDRTTLVRIAIKKAEEKFNSRFNNVFFVGDSPKDIKSGKEAKVKTIGVTTGIYSKEQLGDAGADFVIANLKDILEIVL